MIFFITIFLLRINTTSSTPTQKLSPTLSQKENQQILGNETKNDDCITPKQRQKQEDSTHSATPCVKKPTNK